MPAPASPAFGLACVWCVESGRVVVRDKSGDVLVSLKPSGGNNGLASVFVLVDERPDLWSELLVVVAVDHAKRYVADEPDSIVDVTVESLLDGFLPFLGHLLYHVRSDAGQLVSLRALRIDGSI